jgi:hypothetical protein
MNPNYIDHKAIGVVGFYAYSSTVGGRLCLLLHVGVRTLPLLRSRHNIPPIFEEAN